MKHVIENGVHDIPNEVYHGSHGISRSAICEFKKSPRHYWFKYINPVAVAEKSSPEMRLGEYVHALVLEPEYFKERYIVSPFLIPVPKAGLLKDLGREEFDKQKAAREATQMANDVMMAEFAKNAVDKEIISPSVYNEAKAYADAVLNDDIAKALFIDVAVEKSIYFTHKLTGLQCKVRPDAWASGVVTDLKTCKDAGFSAFQSAAYRGGYFIQAAMIKQALDSLGIKLEKFIFYCVEKTQSAPCVWYELDEDSLERGENQFNNLMYEIAHCIEHDKWGSYEPQTLSYPKWAQYEDL